MDDFNFDSLDLGRTWSPPTYVATAPPTRVQRQKAIHREGMTLRSRQD